MNLTDSIIRLKIGASIAPPANSGDTRGKSYIGREIERRIENATVVWAARLWFGDNVTTVGIDFETGTINPTAVGITQVETTAIVAAGGCTAAGNLPVVVTSAGMSGSPLTVNVPLSPQAHPTKELIAAAVVAKLAATPVIAARWAITQGTGSDHPTDNIVAVRIYPEANDPTFKIAIPAGLGVTADADSTNARAGAAGVIIERIGGDGLDLHAIGLPLATAGGTLFYSIPEGEENAVTSARFEFIAPGGFVVTDNPNSSVSADTLQAFGVTTLDLIFIGK